MAKVNLFDTGDVVYAGGEYCRETDEFLMDFLIDSGSFGLDLSENTPYNDDNEVDWKNGEGAYGQSAQVCSTVHRFFEKNKIKSATITR